MCVPVSVCVCVCVCVKVTSRGANGRSTVIVSHLRDLPSDILAVSHFSHAHPGWTAASFILYELVSFSVFVRLCVHFRLDPQILWITCLASSPHQLPFYSRDRALWGVICTHTHTCPTCFTSLWRPIYMGIIMRENWICASDDLIMAESGGKGQLLCVRMCIYREKELFCEEIVLTIKDWNNHVSSRTGFSVQIHYRV